MLALVGEIFQGQSGWLSVKGAVGDNPTILPNCLGQNISAKRRGVLRWRKKSPQKLDDPDEYIL